MGMKQEVGESEKMIRRVLRIIVLLSSVCGLAKASELPEINFNKIVFLSSRTKLGKFRLGWPERAQQVLRCARGPRLPAGREGYNIK